MGCVTSKPTQRAAPFIDPSCKECLGGTQLNHWEFKNQFKATSCDKCHRDITSGETVYGCRRCNYDECAECFMSGSPSIEDDPSQQGSFREVPSEHVSFEEFRDALQDTAEVQQVSGEEVPSERVSLEEVRDALQDSAPVQQVSVEEVLVERVSLEEVRDAEITTGESLPKLMVELAEESDLKLKTNFGLMLSSLEEEEEALVSIDKMEDEAAARTLPGEASARSLKEDALHDFEGFTFGIATWCSVCKKFLWGFQEQGDRCKVCAEARCRSCVQSGGRCQGTTTEWSTLWCSPCCRPCCSTPVPESHRPPMHRV